MLDKNQFYEQNKIFIREKYRLEFRKLIEDAKDETDLNEKVITFQNIDKYRFKYANR